MGAAAALTAILFDAYAEHILRQRMAAEILAHLELAAHYQFMHALALVAVGTRRAVNGRWYTAACGCWGTGMLLFGGGLYVSYLLAVNLRPIIPLGGVAYMAGWLCLMIAAWRAE